MRISSKIVAGYILASGLMLCAAAGPSAAQTPRSTATADARQRVKEANDQAKVFRDEEKRIKDKQRASFESKEEWKDTAATYKKAKATYETAQKKALARAQAK